MQEKEISQAVIRRMPRYYRYLGELLEDGVERISSNDLSKRMNVTASQIRQDLNNFGGFGQQGYGYNVKFLYEEIGKILGLNQKHNIIVIGAGNLGQALLAVWQSDFQSGDCFGNEQHLVNTHSDFHHSKCTLQLLVYLVCYEADTDMCFDAFRRKVEHWPHFQV